MTNPCTHLTRGTAGCALAVRDGAVAIVVDALRASTTLAVLLAHGAARILVVARVEDARALAETLPDALLVGERGGERLPGFHLGNSPLEVLASPRMDGRTVVFTSSNGAQRLTASCLADRVLVGSVANASAVATFARPYADATGRDVVCVAAGKYPDETYVSPEDEATGAYLALRIGLPFAEDSQADADAWERRLVLDGLESIFRASRHAQRLMEIGYGEDVLYCTRPDTVTAVPTVTAVVTLHNRDIGVELVALAPNRPA